jgi:hypothetical protein
MKNIYKCFALFFFVLALSHIYGCKSTEKNTFSPSSLSSEITLAQHHGFKLAYLQTDKFELTSLTNNKFNPQASDKVKKLVIYIEGDGRSWINKRTLSKNPTPPYALGLRLAIQDPRNNSADTAVAYLARPCQFTRQTPTPNTCEAKYWSSHRFSPEVIENMNQAIDRIKANANINKIELIGYSGGAAIALLLAAHRDDVEMIRTIAGDVNHDMMSVYHHTTPLPDSLNPANFIDKLKNIKQIHYIGKQDKIVPNYITEHFVQTCADASADASAENKNNRQQIVCCNATHQKGWEKKWGELLRED